MVSHAAAADTRAMSHPALHRGSGFGRGMKAAE
jgi:hypothetical protein